MSSRSKLTLLLSVVALGACDSTPVLPPEVPQAIRTAKCVERALAGIGDPQALTLHDALALAARVQACVPRRPPVVPDAGMR